MLSLTLGAVVFEAVDGRLDLVNFSLEVPGLLDQLILDVDSFLLELLLAGFYNLDNFIDVVVGKGHWLYVVFDQLVSWIFVQHHKPFHEVGVLIHESLSFNLFHVVKSTLEVYEQLRILGLLLEIVFDLLYISLNFQGHVVEDVLADSVQDHLHQFFTVIAECVVDVAALDQEHVHSDLERHLSSYFGNCLLIHVDFFLKSFSLKGLLLQEDLNSFLLLKDEQVIVIDFKGLLHDIKVVAESLGNLGLGLGDNLVVWLDIP